MAGTIIDPTEIQPVFVFRTVIEYVPVIKSAKVTEVCVFPAIVYWYSDPTGLVTTTVPSGLSQVGLTVIFAIGVAGLAGTISIVLVVSTDNTTC